MVVSQTAAYAALAAFTLSSLAEYLHTRRNKGLAQLAFGPDTRPRAWVKSVPILRIIALTLLTWGFTVLLLLTPKVRKERDIKESEYRRVVILLDVSPSMKIRDGGIPIGSESTTQQTRAQRGAEIIQSIINRLYQDEIRYTVVAFYTGARTVVKDTKDPTIVTNIMQDLPIMYAFEGGKTNIFAGLAHTFDLAKKWRPKSATVIMVTDGDTVPATGMPKMPPSISRLLVVGVGSVTQGTHVYDHLSRQNSSALREIATRLGGDYQDANSHQLSSALISNLTKSNLPKDKTLKGLREFARLAILIGAIILTALPFLLEKFGSHQIHHPSQPRSL